MDLHLAKRFPNSRRAIFLCAMFFLLAAPLFAQDRPADPEFARVPFERWLAERPKVQIPWKVSVKSRGLSAYQRLLASFEVRIDGKEVAKRQGESQLIALVQVSDSQGRTYQDHVGFDLKKADPEIQESNLVFSFDALVLPGEYRVVLAVYDTATKERSVTQLLLYVDALKDDPLAAAWRDLPPVEFLADTEPPDAWFRPELTGRLHLPLETKRPVHLDLFLNVTPPETPDAPASRRAPGRAKISNPNLAALLPALKALSQLELANGSMSVVALDLARRRVSFEQQNVKDLDWPRLREALAETNANVIDVGALQGRKQNAAFFRTEMVRRISAGSLPTAGQTVDPLRVLIVLGNPTDFDEGSDLHPIKLDEECRCHVFYISYQLPTSIVRRPRGRLVPIVQLDAIPGLLKPLHPRVFKVASPQAFRKALARILSEISQM
jgi:hypothetical protein